MTWNLGSIVVRCFVCARRPSSRHAHVTNSQTTHEHYTLRLYIIIPAQRHKQTDRQTDKDTDRQSWQCQVGGVFSVMQGTCRRRLLLLLLVSRQSGSASICGIETWTRTMIEQSYYINGSVEVLRHIICLHFTLKWRMTIAMSLSVGQKTNIPWAVRLSWLENAYSRLLLILIRKVGQTGLVHGMRLGFIRCVRARLQVCAQRLRFVPPSLTSRHTYRQTDRHHFDQFIWIDQQAEIK